MKCLVLFMVMVFAWVASPLLVFAQTQQEQAQARAEEALKKWESAKTDFSTAIDRHNQLVDKLQKQLDRFNTVKDKMTEIDKTVVDISLTIMNKVQAAEYKILQIENAPAQVVDGPLSKKLKIAKSGIDAAQVHYNNSLYTKASITFIVSSMDSAAAAKMATGSEKNLKKTIDNHADLVVETLLKKYEKNPNENN